MGRKPDKWFKKRALEQRISEPVEERQSGNVVISYGTSFYLYDICTAWEFMGIIEIM